MRFTLDRCIFCGSPFQREFEPLPAFSDFIDNHGIITNGLFWLCSNECVENAVNTFLPTKFQRYKTAYDDPALPDMYIEEFVEHWESEKESAFDIAVANFVLAVVGELKLFADKRDAKYEEQYRRELHAQAQQQQKQLEKQQRDAERQHQLQQRLEREQQRLRERQEDKKEREARHREVQSQRQQERQQREGERQEEKRQREEEKQQKLDQEEAERQAEEEKWRPRRFEP